LAAERVGHPVNRQLDTQDYQLLDLMITDLEPDLDDLAGDIGMPKEEVRARLARLRDIGVISSVLARLDPNKLGLPITAFFLIRVAQTAEAYETTGQLLRDIDQVEEAYAISGQFDWLAKVRAHDVEDLQALVTRRLALIPGFVRAETLVVLSTACDRVNVEQISHPSP
jgi:DNA-binding Lrp family transcriptional regulator